MVIFDQLRISDCGKQMFLNVHVNTASPFFNDIYLERIIIKTANQVSETTPELSCGDYIMNYAIPGENVKEFSVVWDAQDFDATFTHTDLTQDLFFVYVICKGATSDFVPCTMDEKTTLGVTFDENLLYQKTMGFVKEMSDSCGSPSKGFVDFILLWNAFKASVETEHYNSAIKFYGMLFDGSEPAGLTKKCGCHG